MAKSNFENLEVYQLAEKLSDIICEAVGVGDYFAKHTVDKQLVRSVDSVGANTAEGSGRGTYQDNRRFVRIARGSLNETKHWLRRAFKRNLISEEQVNVIRPQLDELAPRLNGYLKSIGATVNN